MISKKIERNSDYVETVSAIKEEMFNIKRKIWSLENPAKYKPNDKVEIKGIFGNRHNVAIIISSCILSSTPNQFTDENDIIFHRSYEILYDNGVKSEADEKEIKNWVSSKEDILEELLKEASKLIDDLYENSVFWMKDEKCIDWQKKYNKYINASNSKNETFIENLSPFR